MSTGYAFEMHMVKRGWRPATNTLKVEGVYKSTKAAADVTTNRIAHCGVSCVCRVFFHVAGCNEQTGRAVADFLKRLDHDQPLHVSLEGDPGDNTTPLQ